MSIQNLKEKLIRRLAVNYIAYMGQKGLSEDWLEGYFQAKKDAEGFLDQLKIYEPHLDETHSAD
jgi:hypothetical protein